MFESAFKKSIFVLYVFWFALFGSAVPAKAHADHIVLIDRATVAGYELSLWAEAMELIAGDVNLAGQVMLAGLPTSPDDIVVRYILETDAGVDTVAIPLMTAYGLEHHARINLPAAGTYNGRVVLENAEGVVGEVSFEIQVVPDRVSIKILIYALGVFTAAATVWFAREGIHTWKPKKVLRRK